MANKSSITIVDDGGTANDTSDDTSTTKTGEVVTLGGSGKDIIRIASDRNSMDFEGKTPLPGDPQDSIARPINSKVADLSHADAIEISFSFRSCCYS